MIKKIISKSPSKTQKIANQIAKNIRGGEILGLVGDLGGGKTTFVQGLAKGLGIKQKITSPTFVMLRPYSIPKQLSDKIPNQLIHIDLYRLKTPEETETIGLPDFLGKKDNVCVIEWAEKIENILKKFKKVTWIEFEFINQNTRKIIIKNFIS